MALPHHPDGIPSLILSVVTFSNAFLLITGLTACREFAANKATMGRKTNRSIAVFSPRNPLSARENSRKFLQHPPSREPEPHLQNPNPHPAEQQNHC